MELKISKINGKDVTRYKNAETDIKTFFYDDSFEDYNQALYDCKTRVNEEGYVEKELLLEVDFDFDSNEEPFYEKMLSELILSQIKFNQEVSKIDITILPPNE